MQNKGLIRFFAILFAIVCIYQLSFTFVTNKVKKDAVAFSGGDREKELAYLDSIKKEPVYPIFGYSFEEVQEKQINKGLDLEGGINVTLQISVKDIIKGLANNSQNPVFVKALSETEKIRKAQESSFDAFIRAFEIANKEAGGTTRLASPDIFANRNFDEKEININSTDDEVKKVLIKKVDESVESAFQIIRERIDKFGVAQPNIQKIGNTGRILVELPGAKDEIRIKKLLQSTAQLEFWEVYKMEEIGNFLMAANQEIKSQTQPKKEEVAVDSLAAPKSDIEALLTDKADSESSVAGPIIDKMVAFGGGQVLGYYAVKDTAEIAGYFRDAHIRNLLSQEQRYTKFLWSKPSTQYVLDKQLVRSTEAKAEKMEVIELYAIKGNRDNKPALSGGVVVDARSDFDQFGKPAVSMRMNSNGAKEWEKLTREVAAKKGAVAIVLDDQVYSAPNVNEAISGGNSSISGNFKLEETNDLANILKAGKLPASADIIQSAVVGPSLGQQAINNGVMSFIIGFAIVLLWMVVYYGKTGMYANIALLVNLFFIFGVLASLGAVLTLPGIAGIVFTIGTAIDANIIINERVKEELRAGKTIKESVDHAFSWNGALSSIFDANITTALVGIILFIFGSGPIQGFATTLIIGIATSLFTAIFIPMLFIYGKVDKGQDIKFSTKLTEKWFVGTNYNFLGKKKIAYILSIIAVILSFISLSTKGLNPGVDFVGGRTYQVKFEKDVDANQVKEKLVAVFGSAEAKTYGSANQLRITTKYKVDEESTEVDNEINHMLYDNLTEYLPADLTFEQFMTTHEDKTIGVLETSKVGPTIADDLKYDALKAVIGAFIIMFLYILISFRRWQFSLGAVVGLIQNVIIVLGVYSATYAIMPFNMELDQHLIAALLTVVGFSINDTVIVFDRVREFLRLRRTEDTGESFKDTVNLALNTTLSRTINTSLSLSIVLLAIFIFGGESLRGFIFAMLIGIIVGTFTSIFIATPIMADTMIKSGADKITLLEDEVTTSTEIENA
ncbi:MAG TPA: protein translocase subunit SecDF [Flavobacterium sp.]|nr:protein translocase subunit SecDF [Flavobacterium sp.]